MSEPTDDQPSANDLGSPPQRPWERIYMAFFIGVFVTTLIAVPVSMYGLEALKSNLRIIGAIVLTFLVAVALTFSIIFLLRRRIAARLGIPPPGILRDVYDPLVEGLEALRTNHPVTAYHKFRHALAAGVTFYGWLMLRWWMISSSLALVGVFTTVAGTALLFRHNDLLYDHNRLIVDQNKKINEQNKRIQMQNQLLFAQADVEVTQLLRREEERMRRLDRRVRYLKRFLPIRLASPVSVRWCDVGDDNCVPYRSVPTDADPCDVVTPKPEEKPGAPATNVVDKCRATRLLALRENPLRMARDPDVVHAHQAVEVLGYLERSYRPKEDDLLGSLDACGADPVGPDFRELIDQKEALHVAFEAIAGNSGEGKTALVDGRLLQRTVQELAGDLRKTHASLAAQVADLATRCSRRLEQAKEIHRRRKQHHAALAEDVMR